MIVDGMLGEVGPGLISCLEEIVDQAYVRHKDAKAEASKQLELPLQPKEL